MFRKKRYHLEDPIDDYSDWDSWGHLVIWGGCLTIVAMFVAIAVAHHLP